MRTCKAKDFCIRGQSVPKWQNIPLAPGLLTQGPGPRTSAPRFGPYPSLLPRSTPTVSMKQLSPKTALILVACNDDKVAGWVPWRSTHQPLQKQGPRLQADSTDQGGGCPYVFPTSGPEAVGACQGRALPSIPNTPPPPPPPSIPLHMHSHALQCNCNTPCPRALSLAGLSGGPSPRLNFQG